MKLYLLSICLLLSIFVRAQKDVSVILLSPTTGLQVGAGQPFSVIFSIKNESSTVLHVNDSTLIGFYLNNQLLTFGGGAFFVFEHPDKGPGDTILRGISLNFSVAPPPNSLFCIRVVLTNGTFIDTKASNDVFCLPINVGMKEVSQAIGPVRIYPNPAREFLNFSFEQRKASSIAITDITGKMMGEIPITDQDTRLNVSGYAKGIYLYAIRDEKGTILKTGKFSVEN